MQRSSICVLTHSKELAGLLKQHPISGRSDVDYKLIHHESLLSLLNKSIKTPMLYIVDDDLYSEKIPYIGSNNDQDVPVILLCDSQKHMPIKTHRKNIYKVKKPFNIRELVVLINKIDSSGGGGGEIINIGNIEFYPTLKQLKYSGQKIKLTEKESEIILMLHKHLPKDVSKEQLLTSIWGYNKNSDTHTVQTHIYRLRQKLDFDFIRNNDGGYTLFVDSGNKNKNSLQKTDKIP